MRLVIVQRESEEVKALSSEDEASKSADDARRTDAVDESH